MHTTETQTMTPLEALLNTGRKLLADARERRRLEDAAFQRRVANEWELARTKAMEYFAPLIAAGCPMLPMSPPEEFTIKAGLLRAYFHCRPFGGVEVRVTAERSPGSGNWWRVDGPAYDVAARWEHGDELDGEDPAREHVRAWESFASLEEAVARCDELEAEYRKFTGEKCPF